MPERSQIDRRIGKIDGHPDALKGRLNALEKRVEAGFAAVDARFDTVDERFPAEMTALAAMRQGLEINEQRFDRLWRSR